MHYKSLSSTIRRAISKLTCWRICFKKAKHMMTLWQHKSVIWYTRCVDERHRISVSSFMSWRGLKHTLEATSVVSKTDRCLEVGLEQYLIGTPYPLLSPPDDTYTGCDVKLKSLCHFNSYCVLSLGTLINVIKWCLGRSVSRQTPHYVWISDTVALHLWTVHLTLLNVQLHWSPELEIRPRGSPMRSRGRWQR